MHELYLFFAGGALTTVDDIIAAGGAAFVDPLVTGKDPCLAMFPDVAGPHGDVGTLAVVGELGEDRPTRPPAMAPDRQVWIAAGDDGSGPKIGWEKLFPPGHNVLRRLRPVEGMATPLGGVAYLPARLDVLPFKPGPKAFYTPPGKPSDADVAANRLCLQIVQELREGGNAWQRGEFPPRSQELLELAMGRNYRGTPAMWRALGLFDDDFERGAAVLAITGIGAAFVSRLAHLAPQS